MPSAAPRRAPRLRGFGAAALALAIVLAGAGPLAAQAPVLPAPLPLPPALAPPAANADVPQVPDSAGPVPVLFAIFGGIAGMFIGKWALSQGCEENCSEQALYGGMLGILLGGAVGWLVGGGELPDPPPGR